MKLSKSAWAFLVVVLLISGSAIAATYTADINIPKERYEVFKNRTSELGLTEDERISEIIKSGIMKDYDYMIEQKQREIENLIMLNLRNCEDPDKLSNIKSYLEKELISCLGYDLEVF